MFCRPLCNQFPRQIIIVVAKTRAHHRIIIKEFAIACKTFDDRREWRRPLSIS